MLAALFQATPALACELRAPDFAWALDASCLLRRSLRALHILSSPQTLKARNTLFSQGAGSESGSRDTAMISEGSCAANTNGSVPSRRSAYEGEAAFAKAWVESVIWGLTA